MADDYRRVIGAALGRPAPGVPKHDLPAHVTDDHSDARAVARRFDAEVDILRARS